MALYSPIQMAADLPENYAKYPEPFQFIKDVPIDWADTRVLNGEVGDYVTIARKDRNSDDWYLGAITDDNARTLDVPLDFLDAGKRYRAEIYRDGEGADWHGDARFRFARETREVTRDDVAEGLARGWRRAGDPVRAAGTLTCVACVRWSRCCWPACRCMRRPVSKRSSSRRSSSMRPACPTSRCACVSCCRRGMPTARSRYPVVYINDGQDLEDVGVEATLQALYAAHEIEPLIVVAIDMPPDRMGGYGLFDRGARHSLPAQTKYGPVGSCAWAYAQWVDVVAGARHRRRLPNPARGQ